MMGTLMSKMNKDLCKTASDLRAQGKTWAEVGRIMNISFAYARHLAVYNEQIQQRESLWTDGLTPSLGAAVRIAGFNSRQQLLNAIENNPRALIRFIGLESTGIEKLRKWCLQELTEVSDICETSEVSANTP